MGKQRIFYLSCTCSNQMYESLFANIERKPGLQAQKYNRLFAEGFELNGYEVKMVTALPLTRQNYKRIFWRSKKETINNLSYYYLTLVNIPLIKHFFVTVQTAWHILRNANKKESVTIICDILSQSVALGGVLASKLLRCQCIGIVTDLPDMLENNWKAKFNNWVLGKYTQYIFLTEAMNTRINNKGKPYVVLEGHVDSNIQHLHVEEKYKKFVCLYSGGISRKYGLQYLIEGFVRARLQDAELHLYGYGDYDTELKKICEKYTFIKYFGTKLNDYVVREQKKATLLINPRPTHEEFTKYSFPSKNMEYMLSGTPVLTTRLPGMPEEYYPYVYILDKENTQGIQEKLEELYIISREELEQKGRAAKAFVLEHKNNKVQAGKVIEKLIR